MHTTHGFLQRYRVIRALLYCAGNPEHPIALTVPDLLLQLQCPSY
jgi:hypothetical protein